MDQQGTPPNQAPATAGPAAQEAPRQDGPQNAPFPPWPQQGPVGPQPQGHHPQRWHEQAFPASPYGQWSTPTVQPWQAYASPALYGHHPAMYPASYPAPMALPGAAASTPSSSKPALPAKRGPGRPRKIKPATEEDPDYLPPSHDSSSEVSLLKAPKRCVHDIHIAMEPHNACVECEFWTGRYLLKPCYHYAYCVICIEDLVKQGQGKPSCPACDTPIIEFFIGDKKKHLPGADGDDDDDSD